MTRAAISQLAQRAARNLPNRLSSRSSVSPLLASRTTTQPVRRSAYTSRSRYLLGPASRYLSTTRVLQKGLTPETDNPQPKEPESNDTTSSTSKVDISDERYHELSDSYLEALVERLEQLQEEREDVDVEYSAGVLNLRLPPNGDYVLNKQPPNKQIWLSSPLSGPKRYDFVMMSEGQDVKEGTGASDWVYLRDGTTLSELLFKEVGIDMREIWEPESKTSK